MVINGSTSGSIKSTALTIGGVLTAITVYNNSGGASVVRVGVSVSGTDTFYFSFNLAASGATGSSAYQETNINIQTGAQVLIAASAQTFYSFTINPIP